MKPFSIVSIVFVLIFVSFVVLEAPVFIIIALVILYSGIVTYGVINLSANFFIPAYCKAKNVRNEVAITFDDGPNSKNTAAILELLKQHNATASFFVIGKRAEVNEGVLKQISDAGHLIGNHSYSHSNIFPLFSANKIKLEIAKCNEIIEKTTGKRCNWFRPPFGVINPNIAKALIRTELKVSGWNIRTFDTTNRNRTKILKKIERNVKAGSVILLHDSSNDILWLTKEVLKCIENKKLKAVSIDKLFGIQ